MLHYTFPRIVKLKIFKIKSSFVSPEGLKARVNKTCIKIMIFHCTIYRKCLSNDTIHDFSVGLRTGSNPAEMNRFCSHTENYLPSYTLSASYLLLNHISLISRNNKIYFRVATIFIKSKAYGIIKDNKIMYTPNNYKQNYNL